MPPVDACSAPRWREPVLRFLVLALIGGVPSLAAAARLPDWAKPITDTAPPLEDELTKEETRVLFSEIHAGVEKDGTVTTRWRQAIQALNSRVSHVSVRNISFRQGARVGVSKAWHLPLGDRARRSYLPALDLTIGNSFLTDAKNRFVVVDGVTRGSLVFFEFEVTDVPETLAFQHFFLENAATLVERYEIEVPSEGWSLRSDWLRRQGPTATVDGRVWAWEMRDLAAPEDEPMGESAEDTAPLLVTALSPPVGGAVKPRVLQDWLSFAAWVEELYKGRDTVTPEITAAAKSVAVASPDAGFFERVRASALLVRDKVRYLAKEIGIGGYQPRPAGETFSQLYGDCKDKATLLRSLLGANQLGSYPVLVNLSSPATVSDEVPSLNGFNHMVLAVPVPGDLPVADAFAAAVVDGGELGRLLIVDTTNAYAAIGTLPAYLAGKKAFVLAGAHSRLIGLPRGAAASHRIEKRFRTEIHPDGSLSVETEASYSGEPSAEARSAYHSSSVERRKAVEERFAETFVRGELREYSVDAETADGSFIETSSWNVPRLRTGSLREIPLFFGAEAFLPRVSLSKRRTAVGYSYAITVRYETAVSGVPASAHLPEGESRNGVGWSITSKFERTVEGAAVKGTWDLVLSSQRFEPADFAELKKLWQAVSSTGKAAIQLAD